MYAEYLRPLLFQLDPEDAHHLTLALLEGASALPGVQALRRITVPSDPALSVNLWGQTFQTPLGLAAGLDKAAQAVPAFSAMGFGFVEVGTVTPLAQPGNGRPRLFRLPSDEALINRMGFNNAGAEAMLRRLRGVSSAAPVWVNIGKNKVTPNEQAAADYQRCVQVLQPVADAFVINVSSPNTPGLRALQDASELRELIGVVLGSIEQSRVRSLRRPPVLVKLAPDLHPADFEASVEAVAKSGAQGLIISNTTLSREGLQHPNGRETGGLSGKPLTKRSTELVRLAYRQTGGALPIVGVGGVFSAQDAYDKIRAGASLVEVYSALVYQGPGLPRHINQGLLQLLKRDGLSQIAQAVGVEA